MEIHPIACLKKLTTSHIGKNSSEPSLLDIESDEDEFDREGKLNCFCLP